MKKSWLIRKDEEAVSPVIATILMVAITVVLAAVLYVMVSGLIGGGTATVPQVTFSAPESTGAGSWEFSVAGVSSSETLSSYQVRVISTGTDDIAATALSATLSVSSGNLTLAFTDVGGADRLTAGDFFTLSGAISGEEYTFFLIWTATGDVVQTVEINA